MDNVQEETHVLSVMIQESLKQGQRSETKGRSCSPALHSKEKQTDGEEQKSSQGSGR